MVTWRSTAAFGAFFVAGRFFLGFARLPAWWQAIEGIAALAGLKEAPASAAALLAALRRNLALAHLRRGRWADAESVCSAVLQEGLDSKAFFRRGAARLGLDDFDGAVEDLREALGLASETEVPAVRRELAKAQAPHFNLRKSSAYPYSEPQKVGTWT
eukprot:s8761_g1.t1